MDTQLRLNSAEVVHNLTFDHIPPGSIVRLKGYVSASNGFFLLIPETLGLVYTIHHHQQQQHQQHDVDASIHAVYV